MTDSLAQLARRLRAEIGELDRVVERARRAWSLAGEQPGESAYSDSVALSLHALYSGLERLFEQTARHVDGAVPESETWHRDLLQQMSQGIPSLRPSVIGDESLPALDRWRRFRHLVRNVYATSLDPAKMAPIMDSLASDWMAVRAALQAFADYLSEVAALAEPDATAGEHETGH